MIKTQEVDEDKAEKCTTERWKKDFRKIPLDVLFILKEKNNPFI